MELSCDFRNLNALLLSLPMKRRQRLIKNALKSIAARSRKRVQAKAAEAFGSRKRSGKPRRYKPGKAQWRAKSAPRKDVAKSVSSVCFTRRQVGFRVYVYRRRNNEARVMHRNRQGLLKPVAFWASVGTAVRKASRGMNRGQMPQRNFMSEAGRIEDPKVKAEFVEMVLESTRKIATKYGAKLS